MDKRINKIINDFVSKVAEQNPRLVTTYLFGSYAKDKSRTESDIDIALFIDDLDDKEKFDLQVQLIILATKFDLRIDGENIAGRARRARQCEFIILF